MNNIYKLKLNEVFYTYAPQYYVWPLEVHYLGLLFNVSKEPTEEDLKNLAKTYVDNNKALNKSFSPNFLKKFNSNQPPSYNISVLSIVLYHVIFLQRNW